MTNLLVKNFNRLFAARSTVAVCSIEFYLSSQLFADHYTESASPRLPLERCHTGAGLFAHSFIHAIQISNPPPSVWDANELVQGCCGGRERAEGSAGARPPHF